MPGLGLLDVLPQSEVVVINGKDIPVYGISARGVGALLMRFPDLVKLFDNAIEGDAKMDILKNVAPNAIAPIIAAACGNLGDAEAEAVAERLSVETQLEILDAARRLTFKDGLGPFARRLESMMGSTGPAGDLRAPSTNLQKPPPPSEPPQAPESGT